MGTCLGRCLHRSNSGGSMRHRSSNSHQQILQDNSIEFFNLVDTSEEISQPKISASIVSKIFSRVKKTKANAKRRPVLELAEELWCPLADPNYKRLNSSVSSHSKLAKSDSGGDISLQCLDARSLLTRGVAQEHSLLSSSTPPSSLDLEWEHEGLTSPAPWQLLPEEDDFLQFDTSSQNSQTTTATQNNQQKCSTNLSVSGGWSRISTPDSLEWDPVQDTSELAVSELDAETEQLLSEIERLTRTALRETGRELGNR